MPSGTTFPPLPQNSATPSVHIGTAMSRGLQTSSGATEQGRIESTVRARRNSSRPIPATPQLDHQTQRCAELFLRERFSIHLCRQSTGRVRGVEVDNVDTRLHKGANKQSSARFCGGILLKGLKLHPKVKVQSPGATWPAALDQASRSHDQGLPLLRLHCHN